MNQIIWQKPVCQLDDNGLYLGQVDAHLDINARDGSYVMPGGCIDTLPPETRDGQAARWTGEAWEYIPDHRGKTAYRTDNGQTVIVDTVGELSDGLTFEAPPTAWHTWNGEKWVVSKEAKAEQLAQVQAAKQDEANHAAQQFVNRVAELDKVPAFEVETWPLQQAEAEAWARDKNAETPILAQIAAARGVELDELRKKALKKAREYAALSACIAGQRQAYVDQIKQAHSVEAVEAIIVLYHLPTKPQQHEKEAV